MGLAIRILSYPLTQLEAVATHVDTSVEETAEDQVIAQLRKAVAVEDADAGSISDPLTDDDVGQAIAIAIGHSDACSAGDGPASTRRSRREAVWQTNAGQKIAAGSAESATSTRPARRRIRSRDGQIAEEGRRPSVDHANQCGPVARPRDNVTFPIAAELPNSDVDTAAIIRIESKECFLCGGIDKAAENFRSTINFHSRTTTGTCPSDDFIDTVGIQISCRNADAIPERVFVGKEISNGGRRGKIELAARSNEAVDLHARTATFPGAYDWDQFSAMVREQFLAQEPALERRSQKIRWALAITKNELLEDSELNVLTGVGSKTLQISIFTRNGLRISTEVPISQLDWATADWVRTESEARALIRWSRANMKIELEPSPAIVWSVLKANP